MLSRLIDLLLMQHRLKLQVVQQRDVELVALLLMLPLRGYDNVVVVGVGQWWRWLEKVDPRKWRVVGNRVDDDGELMGEG